MPTITSFLDDLYEFPLDRIVEPEEDHEQFLTNWGFTIYRTHYGPGSNTQWTTLLATITAGVQAGLTSLDDAAKEPAATMKAQAQFRLDARSDPATLSGLPLEAARQLYLAGTGGQPMNEAHAWRRVFLLADADVLCDPNGGRLLKVAAADYDAVAVVPRTGPQRYFGWMNMPSTAVLDLYMELDMFFFEQLVRQTAGAPDACWVPDGC